ncbi:SEC-C metal-binding domain-containing protein [Amycolatopsis xylanica]|uniref:SEC-C metal-binding domain-containing protein n=1 Tax=Amycolatopsis xylanica TaxID=589385 RepID=UPI003CCB9416
MEKLGGKDPCPCGSGRRFRQVLPRRWPVRRHARALLLQRLSAFLSVVIAWVIAASAA